ncbi:MAG: zinc-binding dehydrogenase [Arachnia sp.]
MKSVIYDAIKTVHVQDVPIPEPGPGEVVIRNKVALTCGTDVKMYMRGYRFNPPHPMGHEAAGVIVSVGEGVTRWREGDRVVAHNTAPCSMCYWCKRGQQSLCSNLINNIGAYAECWRIPAPIVRQNMFAIPAEMSFEQAALTEPFSCAVYGVSQVPIELGDQVVVNGCGPIGLMFIRLAVIRGARVIATDVSPTRLQVAARLGASQGLLITEGMDQAAAIQALTDDSRGVDLGIEATGLPQVWQSTFNTVRPGGTALFFGGAKSGSSVTLDATKLHYEQITVKGVYHTTPLHVSQAFELLKMGVITAQDMIQHGYPVEQTEEALLEHASGAVIKNKIVFDW